jgi:hypothetical protein
MGSIKNNLLLGLITSPLRHDFRGHNAVVYGGCFRELSRLPLIRFSACSNIRRMCYFHKPVSVIYLISWEFYDSEGTDQ